MTSNLLYYPKAIPEVRICSLAPDGRHSFQPPNTQCDWCGFGGVIVSGEVLYVPTEKGVEYHQCTQPNVLLFGGRGSAKSTIGRWDCHINALTYAGFSYIILRRTFPQLDDSHLKYIPREMKLLGGTYNHSKHIAYYPNGSTGTFRHCATMEDVLNLLSSEYALGFWDEISTFEWEMFTKLKGSIRVPVGLPYKAKVRAATNPLGPSALEINQYFVEKDVDPVDDPFYHPQDWYAIKANLIDNPYINKAEYERQFTGISGSVRTAWVDGDFSFESGIFDLHKTRDGRPYHVIPELPTVGNRFILEESH